MPDTLVKQNATIADTIALIIKVVNAEYNSEFIRRKAMELRPEGDKLSFMLRLFNDVCKHVKYKLDKEPNEMVYKPETTYRNGHGDCKKMTVIIASVLKAVGIEPLLKHVFYDGENYTHVYVIVPFPNIHKYIVLDPVNDCRFNKEVHYSSSNIFDLKGNRMDLYTGNKPRTAPTFMDHVNMGCSSIEGDMDAIMGCISGKDQTSATLNQIFEEATFHGDEAMQGMGRKKIKDALKNLFQKAGNAVKSVGMAPSRGAFLVIVRLNAFHIAEKMAQAWQQDKSGIENMWKGFGGNVDELKKAIVGGSKVSISGPPYMGQGVAAAIATATPVLLAILTKLKNMGIIKPGDKVDTMATDALTNAADLVDTGTVTEDEMKTQPPDGGSRVVRSIDKVVTQAPTKQTKMLLNNAPPVTDGGGGGGSPTHGSFLSPFGMCFWGAMQLSQIHTLLANPILIFIAELVGTYFVFGLIPGMIYQSGHKWKKYISWYFDLPIKFFSFSFNSLKKVSLKK